MTRKTDTWQRLAAPYGRDYGWLAAALEMYPAKVAAAPQGACISFYPKGQRDFGWQYGLQPGLRLHFLLEDSGEGIVTAPTAPADPAAILPPWQALLPQTLTAADRLCIPLKSGRAALGWQLGARLAAIRPLAALRAFYLFVPAAALPAAGALRRTPLADPYRLGRLLDDGWAGIDFVPAGQEVLLQKAAPPAE